MRSNGRRRKGKKHRRSGCGAVSLLVLLILLGAAYWYLCRLVPAAINAAAENFMQNVVAGREERASLFMLDRESGGESLSSLIELFQGSLFTYKGSGGSRLTDLFSGTAQLYFYSGGSLHRASLHLVRRGGEWLIAALPEARVMNGALVERSGSSALHLFYRNERIELPAPAGLKIEAGEAVRAQHFGDAAVIDKLEKICLSRLLRISDAGCEGELEGELHLETPLEVYLVERGGGASGAEQGSLKDLAVGMSDLELYLFAGRIVAARVVKGFMPRTIRVLLRQDLNQLTGESMFHRQIRLYSEDGYTLDGRQSDILFAFEPDQPVIVEPWGRAIKVTPEGLDSIVFQHPVFFTANGGGAMIIENLPREGWPGGKPAYRGTLEIANIDGRLVVINELDLDEYLCTVVPGEMPAAFGPEPLKAQAVAARTYALRSIQSSGYSSYGAHVDDSVLSQVYNNVPGHPAAAEAVKFTAGEVLFYGGATVDARFFSASCGSTAHYHEVWQDPATGSFPGEPVPYLQALSQVPGNAFNLDSEGEASAFLERSDWQGYDSASPYFRWIIKMSGAQLTASINHNLAQRYQEQPEYILTREGDSFIPVEIPRNPLGLLQDIRVIRRGAGGNIMILEVEGTNGAYRIMKEYNIRFTLRPVNYLSDGEPVILERYDGSRLDDYPLLPSAFACFDVERNDAGEITEIFIRGGGSGHGVGMSQYGAKGMAEAGYDYRGILEHYYPGAELRRVYETEKPGDILEGA